MNKQSTVPLHDLIKAQQVELERLRELRAKRGAESSNGVGVWGGGGADVGGAERLHSAVITRYVVA